MIGRPSTYRNQNARRKKPLTIRLTDHGRRLLERLAKKTGLTLSEMLERLIRGA